MKPFIKIKTLVALGISSVVFVLIHRVKLKWGLVHPKRMTNPEGVFFTKASQQKLPYPAPTDEPLQALYFGWWPYELTSIPHWHKNPFNGVECAPDKPWWTLGDFDLNIGDVKCVWELSRFSWALALAERYLLGDAKALIQLNDWISDWCQKNPPFYGVNWKCGQEAAIRVLHLAMTAILLQQTCNATPSVLQFVQMHLARIESTFRYAIAQNNNHATSEAAALFVGGSWLAKNGIIKGKHWEKLGRQWLETLVVKLIEHDGSFSQYSVNYHRVMLDTLSMVEIWRSTLNLAAFSEPWLRKAQSATDWLINQVDPKTGEAPNIGANDSAYLFPLGDYQLRDFRLSTQTASVLFKNACVYADEGPWNARLWAINHPLPIQVMDVNESRLYDDGGYAVLKHNQTMAVFRYPRFRFRPSQADVFHVDLWHLNENLLRDAGSYGYHVSMDDLTYFSGTEGHNTIQFDDRCQMPRLSRFLLGDWLGTKTLEPIKTNEEGVSMSAASCDRHGVYHKRELHLTSLGLTVIDDVSGFRDKAILRWRLFPTDWKLVNQDWISDRGRLQITGNMPIIRTSMAQGWESLHYLKKSAVPVLEVEVHQAGRIVTEYRWNQ